MLLVQHGPVSTHTSVEFLHTVQTQGNIHDGEMAGHPGGQSHILVMLAGPQGPC